MDMAIDSDRFSHPRIYFYPCVFCESLTRETHVHPETPIWYVPHHPRCSYSGRYAFMVTFLAPSMLHQTISAVFPLDAESRFGEAPHGPLLHASRSLHRVCFYSPLNRYEKI